MSEGNVQNTPGAPSGATALMEVKFDDVTITKDDVRNYLCPKATDKEIFMAMGIMRSYKLNPFKREVHLVKYEGSPAEVIVGYETYLKRAERSGKLKGWKVGISHDGKQAWVKIWRSDWTEPFEWYVVLSEFNKQRATWKQIPTFMGLKVAIAQGFRLAFPDELGGMPYTKEEQEVFGPLAEEAPETTGPKRASEIREAEVVAAPQAPAQPAAPAPAPEPEPEKPAPAAPAVPSAPAKKITEPQRKELFDLASKNGVADKSVMTFLEHAFNVKSSKDLTEDQFVKTKEWLNDTDRF